MPKNQGSSECKSWTTNVIGPGVNIVWRMQE